MRAHSLPLVLSVALLGALPAYSQKKSPGATQGVNTCAANLEKLAASVTAGKLADGSKLNQAFSVARQGMVKLDHATAEALLEKGKPAAADRAMDRMADHIELATKWSGQEPDESQNAIVKGIRGAAGGVVEKAGGGRKDLGDKVFGKDTPNTPEAKDNTKTPEKK